MNGFDHIITEARRWVGDWEFVEIEEIIWRRKNGASGLWYPPWREQTRAKISLDWGQSTDALWHEVFHSVTHRAPLLKEAGEWTEGWCCAFSEVMRQEFARFPVGHQEPTTDTQRLYNWPCTLLVKYHRMPDQLRSFWLEANRAELSPGAFSQIMGYDPRTGREI